MRGINYQILLKKKKVSTVIAFGDLQELKANGSSKEFFIESLIEDSIKNKLELELLKDKIFNSH